MGYLCARERRLLSNTQLLRLYEKRRGAVIPRAYERGRVMEYELAYVVRLNGKGKGSIEYIPADEYKREGESK